MRICFGLFGLVLASLLPAAAAECQSGLLLDRGGKDDKSFNTSPTKAGSGPGTSWEFI